MLRKIGYTTLAVLSGGNGAKAIYETVSDATPESAVTRGSARPAGSVCHVCDGFRFLLPLTQHLYEPLTITKHFSSCNVRRIDLARNEFIKNWLVIAQSRVRSFKVPIGIKVILPN